MKAKIWCLGLSRTGTTTLSEVLNKVGYRHIHYPTDEQMLDMNNDGCGDIPVIPVYKQLDKKFPNSKFIYTIRDKDAWLKSMEPYLERKKSWHQSARQINIRKEVYSEPFFRYNTYSESYDFWDKDFREYFKYRPNDFLVLDIIGGDSPQKLAEFLDDGKKYPDVFPHYNKLVDGKGVQIK